MAQLGITDEYYTFQFRYEDLETRKQKIKYLALSHSTACSGLDMEWLKRYNVLPGANTSKAWGSKKIRAEIEFLDWDFRLASKNFYLVKKRHLQLVKEIRPRLVMAPDIMHNDTEEKIRKKLEFVDELAKYAERVVVPIHKFHQLLKDYELAYPNSPSFSPKNAFTVWEVQDYVTHLLGGSPHRQARMMKYFSNVISVDGNSVFRAAISFGKAWFPPNKWVKMPNAGFYNIFKTSIENVLEFWGLKERDGRGKRV